MNAHEIACRNFWNGDTYALRRYHAERAAQEAAERAAVDTAAEYDLTFDELLALLAA